MLIIIILIILFYYTQYTYSLIITSWDGGVPLMWLKLYLRNRNQFVDISGVNSREEVLNCGALQGSILGPLLF